jgi:hypothetical protein
MSLEKALEANTAALDRNTAILTELAELKKAKNATEQPKKPDAKPSKATAAPAAIAPASTTPEPVAATSTLTYDDIKTPFLDLAKRDLAAAQALIAEFGIKTLRDAKPGQYAEILAKLNANSEEGMA